MYKICNNQIHNKQIKTSIINITDSILSNEDNIIDRTFNYMCKFENEYYPNMTILLNEKELVYKIDILWELIEYLKGKEFNNKVAILKRLKKISDSEKMLDYKDKDFIIRYIENNPVTEYFLEYIKDKYNILPELELIYGKYSSILHLIIISKSVIKYYELSFSYVSDDLELVNNNKILLYCNENTNLTSKSKWIKQLIMRYCYFNYILKSSKTPLVLSIFLIKFPKMLYNSDTIGPAEINTGVTNGTYITITRKEEALKTLIHELIHFHNMDFRDIPIKLNELLQQVFSRVIDEGSNMKLNLFEAYTECIASILNICLFYNYDTSITTKKNFNLYIANFITKLQEQVLYTFGKCYTLQKYFKCNEVGINNCEINQNTNLVSYFFIKSYLYFYISIFIKCVNITTFKFIDCEKSFNYLYKIIRKGISDINLNLLYKNCYIGNKLNKKKSLKMVCITENIF